MPDINLPIVCTTQERVSSKQPTCFFVSSECRAITPSGHQRGRPWSYRTTPCPQLRRHKSASWSGPWATAHWDPPWARTGPRHRSSRWPSGRRSTPRPGRGYWAVPPQRSRPQTNPATTGSVPQGLSSRLVLVSGVNNFFFFLLQEVLLKSDFFFLLNLRKKKLCFHFS